MLLATKSNSGGSALVEHLAHYLQSNINQIASGHVSAPACNNGGQSVGSECAVGRQPVCSHSAASVQSVFS